MSTKKVASVLLLVAHPRPDSFNHAIAREVEANLRGRTSTSVTTTSTQRDSTPCSELRGIHRRPTSSARS